MKDFILLSFIRFCRIFALAGVICALVYSHAYSKEDKEAFSATITPLVNEITVREPVMMTLEWKNISKKSQDFFIDSQEFFIYVAFGSEEFQEYQLFYPYDEEIIDYISEWGIGVTVSRGKVHQIQRWIVLARPAGTREWQFLFDRSGEYRIAFNKDGQGAATLKVKEAQAKENKKALKQFSVEAAEVFLGEVARAKAAKPKLKNIVSKNPSSLYAPYASLALAKYQWKKDGGFGLEFSTFKKRLDFVIDKHSQNRPLLEETLYLMIKGLAYQKGGKKEALKYLKMLQEEFPTSPYITEVQEDYGIWI